jgi:hypothetical protein
MKISEINVSDFEGHQDFDFNTLSSFKFGGVYIIYSIDKNNNKEIVKIGESNFIYRRIANYLTPLLENELRCGQKLPKDKKITKRTIQCEMKNGKARGLIYKVIWKIVENQNERKQLERDLIKDFIQTNQRKPIMNRINA